MLATLLGMLTVVSALQLQKALLPTLTTPLGITTPVRPLQPENALSPTLVTPFGIVNTPVLADGQLINRVLLLLNRTPSTLVYDAFWDSTVIQQPSNGASVDTKTKPPAPPSEAPMLVTLLGRYKLLSALQLQKAPYPMLVTPFAITTLVRPLQPSNA